MAKTQQITPDFYDVWQMLYRRWILFLGIILGTLIFGVILLRALPQQYTASMIIGPMATDGVAGRGARLTLQTPQTEIFRPSIVETDRNESLSDFSRFLELLTSSEVIAQLDQQRNGQLMQALYADQWNAQTQTWQTPSSMSHLLKSVIKVIVGQKTWSAPTHSQASKYLKHAIKIEPVGTSAMRKISFRHQDAEFGKQLLNNLYEQADQYLRQQARTRTKAEIDYLKQALNSVSVLEHRKALTNLLAAQEQTQMMINVDLPFAGDRIEAATTPSIPNWPNPFAVLSVFFVAGILMGLFIVYVLETRHAK